MSGPRIAAQLSNQKRRWLDQGRTGQAPTSSASPVKAVEGFGLDNEMALMRDMGINAIRLFSDIPPRWVEYL